MHTTITARLAAQRQVGMFDEAPPAELALEPSPNLADPIEACKARGITVDAREPDERGNCWEATIPRKGRSGPGVPLAGLWAPTADEAARMALRFVGARGWKERTAS